MTESTQPQNVRSLLRRRLPFEIASSLAIVILVGYALRTVDFRLLGMHLMSQISWQLLVCFGLSLLVFVAHGTRLSRLLGRTFLVSFQIVNLGSILNVVLPFRIGDVARIYLSRRYFSISSAQLLAAALVEKFFDLAVVMVLVLVALMAGATRLIPAAGVTGLVVTLVAVFVAYLVFQHARWLDNLLGFLPPRLREQALSFRQHLSIRQLPVVTLMTALIWVLNLGCTLVTFSVLVPSISFTPLDAIILTVITALAVAIPGAPAGLGIFEAGVVAYLTQAHAVSPELALASALIFHAIIVVPPLAGLVLGSLVRLVYDGRNNPAADL